MRVIIKAVTRADIQGTSKKGNPYHIDETRISIELPFDDENGFGVKLQEYSIGKAKEFESLANLRGKLPVEADIELGVELNQYGQPVTKIKDFKLVKPLQEKVLNDVK